MEPPWLWLGGQYLTYGRRPETLGGWLERHRLNCLDEALAREPKTYKAAVFKS